MPAQSSISILRELEQQSIASSEALAGRADQLTEWRGLMFSVGDINLVTSIGDVFEILDPLKCTTVPKGKPWFLGVANVRGNLIPVMDLQGFLYGDVRAVTNRTRVLVFRHGKFLAGVTVASVSGLRQFYQSDIVAQPPIALDEKASPYVKEHFQFENQELGVFKFSLLAGSEAFLNVSELKKQ